MSEHTKEPIKVNYRRITPVNGKQDGTDDICHVYGDELQETAIAARIVALWNAFLGIPTDKLAEHVAAVARLREAAEKACDIHDDLMRFDGDRRGIAESFGDAMDALKAALAAMEGQ